MNGESILDAMHYLDDELIEATAKIRTRKRKSYLYVLAAAAACLCLFIVTRNEKSLAPTEAERPEYSGLSDRYYGDLKPGAAMENDPETPAEYASAGGVMVTATVKVTALHENGFTASVTADSDGGDTCRDLMVIQCRPEVLRQLQIGYILQISYAPGETNLLLDYSVVTENE